MGFLSDQDTTTLKQRFEEELTGPVTLRVFTQNDRLLLPGREPCRYCAQTVELLEELSGLSDRIELIVHDIDGDAEAARRFGIERVPAIVPTGEGDRDYGIRFYGIPAGYEFATLIDALVDVSAGQSRLPGDLVQRLEAVDRDLHFKVFVTPT